MSTAARRRGSRRRSCCATTLGMDGCSALARRPGRVRRNGVGSRAGSRAVASNGMQAEEAIRTRRTHKAYTPEPLDRETLDELFELARWAPNHNLTNPWRFRVVGPDALERLKR